MIIVFALASLASAQSLQIKSSGETIPARFKSQIELTLLKEVEFYSPLGLPDTVTVNLKIFKDIESCNSFLRQYIPTAYGNYCGGMFLPEIETAVLASTEHIEATVRVLFHEISHSLYHKVLDASPEAATSNAYSLNEGLAGYFQFMALRKDGTAFQKPDILYVNSVKSLIEIEEFDLTDYLRMDSTNFKEKHRYEGSISYYASYVIVAVLFEKLGMEQMRNLLSMIRSGTTYEDAVESLYPNGKAGLYDDIVAFVMK